MLFIGFICGCDLLGNQEPQESIQFKGELNSMNDLQNLLTGTYDNLQQYSSRAIYYNDIIADDAVNTTSATNIRVISKQKLDPGITEGVWNNHYTTINGVNIILDNVESVEGPDVTQEAKDNIRGQALFIRALTYFYLVDYWALPSGATTDDSHLGVPLQLTPVYSSGDFKKPSRSTVAQVYEQIETDLKKAEKLTSPTNPKSRATPSAATALRARIALIRHNYQKAADLAGEIIQSNIFSLDNDVTTYFWGDELSAEAIFSIENTVQDHDEAGWNLSAEYAINGRDDIQINITFRDALSRLLNDRQQAALDANSATAVDTRKTELIYGKDENGNLIVREERAAYSGGESNSAKYKDGINSSDNAPVLRYAEIILTRAEALAAPEVKGINTESIDLLNQIRRRAFIVNGGDISLIDYTMADFTTPQELIDAIFLERRVELAFEGHRKRDLQRRKMNVQETAWDSDILTFPIPQSQIEANENISQNPAYK
ncbi:MAG TPA: RagB/SusD family nutrient uptake outer membrane protein [Bacteroidales bacterium]|nr:RagB/SusD family nutrient uptake outer membrane protein [Bacteroidales bacterium]